MIWNNPVNVRGQILIENDVISLIQGHSQQLIDRPEAGGILLGYRRKDHLHVVTATSPQPGDQQGRFHFHRRDPAHQKVALRQWELSDSMVDYLGEWHTHPVSHPTPSGLDLSEWKKICTRKNVNMVFLIVGTANSYWLGVGMNKRLLRATEADQAWEGSLAHDGTQPVASRRSSNH